MITEKNVAGASYAGGAVSIFSALTWTDIGVIVGILTALATFGFNFWFRLRQDRREEREHNLRVGGLLEDRRKRNEPHDGKERRRRE